jgi:hypothetical protein
MTVETVQHCPVCGARTWHVDGVCEWADGHQMRGENAMIDLGVMRLAEMHQIHPRQDNSRVCAKCGERVGIYPSGQALLRRRRKVRILCNHCLEPVGHVFLAPGAEHEPSESVPVDQGTPR